MYGNHGGAAFPLREGKTTTWDGGTRVPFIAWWPGHIPEGAVCGEVACHDVAARHPEVVKRMLELAEPCRADRGDTALKRKGSGVRPPGGTKE